MPARIEVVNEINGSNPGKRYEYIIWGNEGEGVFTSRLNKAGVFLNKEDPFLVLVAERFSMTPDDLIRKLETMHVGQELI